MKSAVVLFSFCLAFVSARILTYEQRYVYSYGKGSDNDNESGGGEGGEEEDTTRPPTSFSCDGKADGYYADVETNCEAFHYCQTWQFPGSRNKTVDWTFACPETTVFNQELLTCTSSSESSGSDCQKSSEHFDVNQNQTQVANPSQQGEPSHGNAAQVSVSDGTFIRL